MRGHPMSRTLLAAFLALTAASTALAASNELVSTMRIVNAVAEHQGFRINPAFDAAAEQGPDDLAPLQAFEIMRPVDKPVTIGRLFTSCTCIQLESPKRTFAPGERAILQLRNTKPTPLNGQVYAIYVQITSPIRTTLRFDTFVQSSSFPEQAGGGSQEQPQEEASQSQGQEPQQQAQTAESGVPGEVSPPPAEGIEVIDMVAVATGRITDDAADKAEDAAEKVADAAESAEKDVKSAVDLAKAEMDAFFEDKPEGSNAPADPVAASATGENSGKQEGFEAGLGENAFSGAPDETLDDYFGDMQSSTAAAPTTPAASAESAAGESLRPASAPASATDPAASAVSVRPPSSPAAPQPEAAPEAADVPQTATATQTVAASPPPAPLPPPAESAALQTTPNDAVEKPMQTISLITIGVSDMARSIRFYEELGWRRTSRNKYDQTAFFQLHGQVLALYPMPELLKEQNMESAKPAPGGVTLALHLANKDDVYSMYQRFIDAGGATLREPMEMPSGAVTSYVADPDGNPWEISWVPQFRVDDEGKLWLP